MFNWSTATFDLASSFGSYDDTNSLKKFIVDPVHGWNCSVVSNIYFVRSALCGVSILKNVVHVLCMIIKIKYGHFRSKYFL